jgi:hypothetical protein
MSRFYVVIVGSVYADNICEAAKLAAEDAKLLENEVSVYEITTTEKDPYEPTSKVVFA